MGQELSPYLSLNPTVASEVLRGRYEREEPPAELLGPTTTCTPFAGGPSCRWKPGRAPAAPGAEHPSPPLGLVCLFA